MGNTGSRLAAALILLAVGGCESVPKDEQVARDAVKRKLKDPESAKFKDFAKCPKNSDLFSISFNAKNSFGAYDGFETAWVLKNVAWTSSDDWPAHEMAGQYSIIFNFIKACYIGGDPDPIAYLEGTQSGTSMTISEMQAAMDSSSNAVEAKLR